MSITPNATSRPRVPPDRYVAAWLIVTALMIIAMVVVGGVTRLTESGLSITEWKLVTGILPPLTDAGWQDTFAKYQQIPEYREVHNGMSLEAFKGIFFWEYTHRLLGRVIGMVALLPPLVFLAQGRIPVRQAMRYLAVPILVGMQGVLGWYMVKSGLSVRTSVSQYRLTAHLALAVIVYAYAIWLVADLLLPRRLRVTALRSFLRPISGLLVALVFLTMLAGGFTAGLKAGLTYNTFPLMDGHVVPTGYFSLEPWWRNFFENIAAVQFDHRALAIATLFAVIGFWVMAHERGLTREVAWPLNAMLIAVLLQVSLGISTLLLVVPIPLAAAHQLCAVLLLTCALLTAHGVRNSTPT